MRTERLIDKEVEKVLGALTPSNALVCEVCLHTGLRVNDVLSLRTQQLAPRFWVTESKTKKRKQIGLPGPLLAAIQRQAGKEWAFPGRKPENHRTRQAVWKDVKRAAKAYRLPQNVGTHSFRKTYAGDLMDEYGDIEKVQKMMNHSSPVCTLIYLMGLESLSRKKRSGLDHAAPRYKRRIR